MHCELSSLQYPRSVFSSFARLPPPHAFAELTDICRRLPPQDIEENLANLVSLCPDLADDILSSVDQPLKIKHDAKAAKSYLVCDYNRDGDSYRSVCPFLALEIVSRSLGRRHDETDHLGQTSMIHPYRTAHSLQISSGSSNKPRTKLLTCIETCAFILSFWRDSVIDHG